MRSSSRKVGLRDECLNQHWFLSLDEARAVAEAWRDDYNRVRPHGALGNQTPFEFARPCMANNPTGTKLGAASHTQVLSLEVVPFKGGRSRGCFPMATNSGDGGNTDQMTSPAKGFGSGASTAYEPPAASSMSGSRPRSCHPWQRSRITPMSASGLRDKSSTMSARDFVPPA